MNKKIVLVTFATLLFISLASSQADYGNFSNNSFWSSIKIITGFVDSDQRLQEFSYFFLLGLAAWLLIWLVVVAMGYDSTGADAVKRLWLIGLVPILISIWHYSWTAIKLDTAHIEWSAMILGAIVAGSGGIIILLSRGGFLVRILHNPLTKKFIKKGVISGWLSFIAGKLWKVFAFAFLFAFLMAFPFIGRIFGILNLTLIHGLSNYPAFFFQAITLAVVFGIIPQIVFSWMLFARIRKRERKAMGKINSKRKLYQYQKGVMDGMKGAENILEADDPERDAVQAAAEQSIRRRFGNI